MEHPSETAWRSLLAIVTEINAIRSIESTESLMLSGPHAAVARRMLDICAVKKMGLEKDLATLVDRVATDPYWDDAVQSLDRELLARKIREFGGRH